MIKLILQMDSIENNAFVMEFKTRRLVQAIYEKLEFCTVIRVAIKRLN